MLRYVTLTETAWSRESVHELCNATADYLRRKGTPGAAQYRRSVHKCARPAPYATTRMRKKLAQSATPFSMYLRVSFLPCTAKCHLQVVKEIGKRPAVMTVPPGRTGHGMA